MTLKEISYIKNRFVNVKSKAQFYIISLLILTSCETVLVPGYQRPEKPVPNRDLAMNMTIYFVRRSYRKVELKSHQVYDLVADTATTNSVNVPKDGDLEITQYDIKSVPLQSLLISDPLAIKLDTTGNPSALSNYKYLDSADFSAYIHLLPETKFIGVHTINNPKSQLYLLRL